MRPIEKGAPVRRVSGGHRPGLTGTLKRAPGRCVGQIHSLTRACSGAGLL